MGHCSITWGRRVNRNQFIFPHSRMDMKVFGLPSVSQSGTEAPAPSSEVTLTRRGVSGIQAVPEPYITRDQIKAFQAAKCFKTQTDLGK